ncbi:uncharacterized protein TRIADDRAFT_32519 [Trichoplax adhaerens]|uniref:Mitoferrin-1 n=1 Tax=Trichoplax adhaerens TaxID=10228 RepID=B3SB63_TRIAD|nr:hypothetical protein TRIADDRAFT_32519 [Trichoplax adhaerens]EDV20053.1 hypothetical protein TRIADDRAFT_32519 [Trichoplax adhaerens]|eukprot:XP_002117437.1 hypothetical protein TRIADDRAFT_32519 [Trichoplax adhaerens]
MEFDDYENLPTHDVGVHMMAGAAAGVLEHCVMYPVDCVKTRMQSLKPNPNAVYKGIYDGFRSIAINEGRFTVFRGMNVVICGAAPAHALYFSCYESVRQSLGGKEPGHHPVANATAAVTATAIHDAAMTPVDAVKQRLQIYKSPYRGAIHCIKEVYKSEGVKAFYRSYTTQLLMNIPFQCSHFLVYEYLRETLNPARTYDPKTHVIAGAAAGAFAASLTTPLDVAKTLLNTQEKSALKLTSNRRYVTGIYGALKTIYSMRGIAGYFQGIKARIVFQMPSTAICWSVYEFFKHFLLVSQASKKESLF